MNLHQSNKMAMYKAVEEVCNLYKTTWESIPMAVILFTEYKEKLNALVAATQRQEQDFTGVTADKKGLRQQMSEQAYVMAQALSAYANITNNKVLAGRVKYTRSEFSSAKDAIVQSKAEVVLEVAQEHVDNLADYGITAQHVSELETAISNYAEVLSSPRVAINQRKEATGSIQKLIVEINFLLKQKLDKLMVQFENTEFYATYKAARTVVDRRGQRRRETTEATDTTPEGGVS